MDFTTSMVSVGLARLRRLLVASATFLSWLALPDSVQAASIQAGNVTTTLGPKFFLDEATNGGVDTDLNQPGVAYLVRSFNGLLTPDQGPTRIVLTGFGFALHTSATANDAATVAVGFTYLGADEVAGGGDDVVVGSASGNLIFTGGGEYAFAFDTPLVANLNITGTRFQITIAPSNLTSNGSLKIKSLSPSYAPYVSVAGDASSTIVSQRVNLAKYQTVTASSVAGNRLATYATDGDAGNDSHWQSQNWAFNNARIDFPFPVEIGSAQVFMGIDDTLPLAKFGIQYLVGTTWTTIPVTDISNNTNVERNFVFSTPVTASSFRIMATDPTIKLREFALYPPNGPSGYPLGTDVKVNLALQRPAVASSHTPGQFPINAVDGRTHARSSWQTTTAGLNTLDIEMVASTKIGSVHLYSGSRTASALGDFTLKSWNGTAWIDIPGGTVTGNTTKDLIVSFTTPPTTRKVRLEFTKSGTTPTVIRELQIFPANTGNVGYPLGTNINPSGGIPDYEDFNDAFYQITSVAANRDIAVATGGQPALEPTGITTAQAQYQVLLNLADGTYRLRNRDSGLCLAGAQLSKTAGAFLVEEPYVALPHQEWILELLGGGRYRIINAWSGLAMDTAGGATTAGTRVVQNTASNATSQQWRFNYDTWAPKKGLGHGELGPAFNTSWLYRWGANRPTNLPTEVPFHPMQWGNYNWTYNTGSGPIWQRNSEWRKSGDGIMMMGFNEPDRTDQSNIAVADAVNLWPQLMALNLPLVGPSPADDGTWLTAFTTAATNRGFRWDYTAIHDYPGPNGGSSDGLIGKIQRYFNDYSLPVWLTEFSFVDWGGNQSWSEEDCYQTLAEFLWRAESFAPLRKYALFVFTADANNPQPANPWQVFTPAPRSNSYDTNGNMTAFGKLYAAWDGDATVRAAKTYYFHNKSTRKRLANITAQTSPAGRDIRTDGDLVHWTLVSTGVTNRYYVVSSLDGRRLSTTATSGSAGTVSLAAAGATGTAVEWSLTSAQHGWQYLVHSSSTRQLQLVFNNTTSAATYSMATRSTTTDAVQWRFIVPLSTTGNTAPVLSAIPAQTVNEGVQLTFTATATDADLPANTLTYTLRGAPSGAAIHPTTGVFAWTPTEVQGPGGYIFTVRVSDGNLTADQAVTVTVNEVNTAPVLTAIPAQTVNEGAQLTFTATTNDADVPANTLTYSLVGAPTGAAIHPTTGVFTWSPTGAQGAGDFTFTVRVNDGNLNTDRLVTVKVIPSATTDTDGDGLSSLMEYALGTDPVSSNTSPFGVISANTNNTVTLTFTWNWQASGLSWQLRHGHSLTNMADWTIVSPGTTTVVREGNLDRITVSPASNQPDRGFYILEVLSN